MRTKEQISMYNKSWKIRNPEYYNNYKVKKIRTIKTKVCHKCFKRKPNNGFYMQKNGILTSECKKCTLKRTSLYWYTYRNKLKERERIRGIEYRKKIKNNPQRYNKYVKNKNDWNTLQKSKAHSYCNCHLRKNAPKICPICGKKSRLDGHHPDYRKYKYVIWCCRSCHMQIHLGKIKLNNQGGLFI